MAGGWRPPLLLLLLLLLLAVTAAALPAASANVFGGVPVFDEDGESFHRS